ncbi:structural maintenance of chromosomes protein 5-like [Apostichopus japonicus]|uniref:structural maintenance of chromosomes protein 5-like n=1 Tax=Stichopus japonicus TaxID=307972 RepID=UPI003AB845B4
MSGRAANKNKKAELAQKLLDTRSSKSQLENGTTRNANRSDFVRGSVVRMKMQNFVTYDECEVLPGPHLNMIVGPNGTGKSSIVCALCLGLAGSTSLLGRGKEVGEYVKHGTNKATLEIELFNPSGQNFTIRREIYRKDNKSVFTLNGRQSGPQKVKEMVTGLNIQINNLCQFLPQDMVVEFAKMTKVELLENTEKAVGQPELYENHQRLKTCRNEEKRLERSLRETEDNLKIEAQRNGRLEADVKRFKQRQQHLNKIEILEKKKAWVEYDIKRILYIETKTKKAELDGQVKQARSQSNPLEGKRKALEENITEMDGKMRLLTNQCRQVANKATGKHEKLNDLNGELQEVQDDLKEQKQQEVKRKRKVQNWKQLIDGWQRELDDMPPDEDLKPQLDKNAAQNRKIIQENRQLKNECSEIKQNREQLKREKNDVERRLKAVNDMKDQRLRGIRQQFKDTYNAVMWLRDNQDKFSQTIHEPVILTINVRDPDFTKFFEHVIPMNDCLAFICENADDMELFIKEIRDRQGIKINAVKSPNIPVVQFQPKVPIDKMRMWGFTSYLLALCDAPDAVLAYLCKHHKLHSVPVGSADTERIVEKVIDESGLSKFYTPDTCYTVRQSRYGNRNKSSQSIQVPDAKLLGASTDVKLKRELEGRQQELEVQLQEGEKRYQELMQREKDLRVQDNKLKESRKELLQRRDRRKTIQQNIKAKNDAIKMSEESALNLEEEEKKVKKKILQILNRKVQMIKDYRNLIQECTELCKSKVELTMKYAYHVNKKTAMEAEIRESTAHLQMLEEELKTLNNHVKVTKEEAKQLLRIAQQRTGAPEPSGELKKYFTAFPSVLEELDTLIHTERAHADCCFETDERVVKEYEDRKVVIERLTREVGEKKQHMERHHREIESLKVSWQTQLKELLASINSKFSTFFAKLNCAGEVSLDYEAEEDFDKYGVKIRVKFRDTDELKELTSHYQSGGERSVATILYLMALQELNKCPFRVVDEINQGMDTNNERKVFEFVVSTACRENTSQYFLITPKLLPDLQYSSKMKVLCVMNGHWMLPYKHWDLRKFCRIRQDLETE